MDDLVTSLLDRAAQDACVQGSEVDLVAEALRELVDELVDLERRRRETEEQLELYQATCRRMLVAIMHGYSGHNLGYLVLTLRRSFLGLLRGRPDYIGNAFSGARDEPPMFGEGESRRFAPGVLPDDLAQDDVDDDDGSRDETDQDDANRSE